MRITVKRSTNGRDNGYHLYCADKQKFCDPLRNQHISQLSNFPRSDAAHESHKRFFPRVIFYHLDIVQGFDEESRSVIPESALVVLKDTGRYFSVAHLIRYYLRQKCRNIGTH